MDEQEPRTLTDEEFAWGNSFLKKSIGTLAIFGVGAGVILEAGLGSFWGVAAVTGAEAFALTGLYRWFARSLHDR